MGLRSYMNGLLKFKWLFNAPGFRVMEHSFVIALVNALLSTEPLKFWIFGQRPTSGREHGFQNAISLFFGPNIGCGPGNQWHKALDGSSCGVSCTDRFLTYLSQLRLVKLGSRISHKLALANSPRSNPLTDGAAATAAELLTMRLHKHLDHPTDDKMDAWCKVFGFAKKTVTCVLAW